MFVSPVDKEQNPDRKAWDNLTIYDNGRFYAFFNAMIKREDDRPERPPVSMDIAESKDGVHWRFIGRDINPIPGALAGYGVFRVGDSVMYYPTCTNKEKGIHFKVYRSKDLLHWEHLGDEYDVLGRVASAAHEANADLVVRVCADNPFVDPGEIDRLIDFYCQCHSDYACNHQDRLGSGYPDGIGAEILSFSLLKYINVNATDPHQREHVTLYLWDNADQFSLSSVPVPPELTGSTLSFDVDTPTDLVRLEAFLLGTSLKMTATAAQIVHEAVSSDHWPI